MVVHNAELRLALICLLLLLAGAKPSRDPAAASCEFRGKVSSCPGRNEVREEFPPSAGWKRNPTSRVRPAKVGRAAWKGSLPLGKSRGGGGGTHTSSCFCLFKVKGASRALSVRAIFFFMRGV